MDVSPRPLVRSRRSRRSSHRSGAPGSSLVRLAGPLLVALLALLCSSAEVEAQCRTGGLDGTFVQLQTSQLTWDRARWRPVVRRWTELGLSTVVVQFTGDEHGPFERRFGADPIADLLAETDEASMEVWLGLHHVPLWPDWAPDPFPPLQYPGVTERLVRLCRDHDSCEGFYVSPEIDDETWSSPEQTRRLSERLGHTLAGLRAAAPDKRISLSPFFTGHLEPQAFAAWLAALVARHGVDVVMLQGGTGTHRAGPERLRGYLDPLARRLSARSIELWLVVELFDQLGGPPLDEGPFRARPARWSVVRPALMPDAPVARRIAFSVPDYMSEGSARGRRLRCAYRAWCAHAP